MKKIDLRNLQDSSEIREGTTYETSVDENNNRRPRGHHRDTTTS
jgi:hypothetical protein